MARNPKNQQDLQFPLEWDDDEGDNPTHNHDSDEEWEELDIDYTEGECSTIEVNRTQTEENMELEDDDDDEENEGDSTYEYNEEDTWCDENGNDLPSSDTEDEDEQYLTRFRPNSSSSDEEQHHPIEQTRISTNEPTRTPTPTSRTQSQQSGRIHKYVDENKLWDKETQKILKNLPITTNMATDPSEHPGHTTNVILKSDNILTLPSSEGEDEVGTQTKPGCTITQELRIRTQRALQKFDIISKIPTSDEEKWTPPENLARVFRERPGFTKEDVEIIGQKRIDKDMYTEDSKWITSKMNWETKERRAHFHGKFPGPDFHKQPQDHLLQLWHLHLAENLPPDSLSDMEWYSFKKDFGHIATCIYSKFYFASAADPDLCKEIPVLTWKYVVRTCQMWLQKQKRKWINMGRGTMALEAKPILLEMEWLINTAQETIDAEMADTKQYKYQAQERKLALQQLRRKYFTLIQRAQDGHLLPHVASRDEYYNGETYQLMEIEKHQERLNILTTKLNEANSTIVKLQALNTRTFPNLWGSQIQVLMHYANQNLPHHYTRRECMKLLYNNEGCLLKTLDALQLTNYPNQPTKHNKTSRQPPQANRSLQKDLDAIDQMLLNNPNMTLKRSLPIGSKFKCQLKSWGHQFSTPNSEQNYTTQEEESEKSHISDSNPEEHPYELKAIRTRRRQSTTKQNTNPDINKTKNRNKKKPDEFTAEIMKQLEKISNTLTQEGIMAKEDKLGAPQKHKIQVPMFYPSKPENSRNWAVRRRAILQDLKLSFPKKYSGIDKNAVNQAKLRENLNRNPDIGPMVEEALKQANTLVASHKMSNAELLEILPDFFVGRPNQFITDQIERMVPLSKIYENMQVSFSTLPKPDEAENLIKTFSYLDAQKFPSYDELTAHIALLANLAARQYPKASIPDVHARFANNALIKAIPNKYQLELESAKFLLRGALQREPTFEELQDKCIGHIDALRSRWDIDMRRNKKDPPKETKLEFNKNDKMDNNTKSTNRKDNYGNNAKSKAQPYGQNPTNQNFNKNRPRPGRFGNQPRNFIQPPPRNTNGGPRFFNNGPFNNYNRPPPRRWQNSKNP